MGPGAGGLERYLASCSAAVSKVGTVTAFCTELDSYVNTTFPLPVNIYLKMLQTSEFVL